MRYIFVGYCNLLRNHPTSPKSTASFLMNNIWILCCSNPVVLCLHVPIKMEKHLSTKEYFSNKISTHSFLFQYIVGKGMILPMFTCFHCSAVRSSMTDNGYQFFKLALLIKKCREIQILRSPKGCFRLYLSNVHHSNSIFL